MVNWVKCTAWNDGADVWVNFGNAVTIQRDDTKQLTTLTFIGSEKTVTIKESVEQLTKNGFKNA
jgi:hypothetical protein